MGGRGVEIGRSCDWERGIPKGINGSSLRRLVSFCQLFSS